MKKVVVIGGGTGTSVVLSALKQIPDIQCSSIVAMSDSGGSTGRLRDEFGFAPVGDLRQSLAALASTQAEQWIHQLLVYRFSKGEGLKGHSFGNLMLTVLQEMTGSTAKALEVACKILNIDGFVYPVTEENVQLRIEYEDGKVLIGEHYLDETFTGNNPIRQVSVIPQAHIYEGAKNSLQQADLIIIGPGDFYSSLVATLVVDGIKEAFATSSAPIVFISNLMSRYTQTDKKPLSWYVTELEKYIGKPVTSIFVNSQPYSATSLTAYAVSQEFPVVDDLSQHDKRVICKELLADSLHQQQQNDSVIRSMLRHSPEKMAEVLKELLI